MRIQLPNKFNKEHMRYAYQETMRVVEYGRMPKNETEPIPRSETIKFLMKALRIDLFGSSLTRLLLLGTNGAQRLKKDLIPYFPFPKGYKPELKYDMPVGDNTIISIPWHKERWWKALYDLTRSAFDPKLNYSTGTFFPELQLITVDNGRHHLAAASLKEQGKLNVRVYPLTVCFPYFKTDGAYWINTKTKIKTPVKEIRFALLYALARELWKEDLIERNEYDEAFECGW